MILAPRRKKFFNLSSFPKKILKKEKNHITKLKPEYKFKIVYKIHTQQSSYIFVEEIMKTVIILQIDKVIRTHVVFSWSRGSTTCGFIF